MRLLLATLAVVFLYPLSASAGCIPMDKVVQDVMAEIEDDAMIRAQMDAIRLRIKMKADGMTDEEIAEVFDSGEVRPRGEITPLNKSQVMVLAAQLKPIIGVDFMEYGEPDYGLIFQVRGILGTAGAIEVVLFDENKCGLGRGSVPAQIFAKIMEGRGA